MNLAKLPDFSPLFGGPNWRLMVPCFARWFVFVPISRPSVRKWVLMALTEKDSMFASAARYFRMYVNYVHANMGCNDECKTYVSEMAFFEENPGIRGE